MAENSKMSEEIKSQDACPIANKCGGCFYQGMDYSKQLQKKREYVGKLLDKYGRIEPIIGMNARGEEPKYYRNKVHHVISRDRKKNIVSGFYQEASHKVVTVNECGLEDKQSQAIIKTVCELVKSFKLLVYSEDNGYGLFRHVLVRKGFSTGQIMVVLVVASSMFPSKNNFIKALRKAHPKISTIVININNRTDSMVLGDRSETVFGKGYIEDKLCGLTFRISPDSFYQINPVQTEKLYMTAIKYAGLLDNSSKAEDKEKVIIDAYCGIGTIGLAAASKCKKAKVIGVEINANAVKDARINAKINGITNAEFYKGDAGVFMEEMAAEGQKADVVFMDPPRAGSDEKFINSVVTLAPERIVYVSCNPQTQANDLKLLTSKGYEVKKIQPVDMFPFTAHVETVCLMSRKN